MGQSNTESFPPLTMNVAKSRVPVQVGGNVQCGLCHDTSPGSSLICLSNQLPITSTSHSPVLIKFSQVCYSLYHYNMRLGLMITNYWLILIKQGKKKPARDFYFLIMGVCL